MFQNIYRYETENQIKQQEVGEQKILGNEQTNSVRGSYSYITPEGQRVSVNYIADENGFRAEGGLDSNILKVKL